MILKEKLLDTGYFIDNEWLDKYCALIEKNKSNPPEPEGCQVHHILQKAYFRLIGEKSDDSTDNLVRLKYGDHVLAHYYLCYCCIEELASRNITTVRLMIGKPAEEQLNNIEEISSFLQKHTKAVQCIENGKTYSSACGAARELGWNKDTYARDIRKCCQGKQYTCHGYHWKYVGETLKQVYCITTDTLFFSIEEASKKMKISKAKIILCCRGKIPSADGYEFEYKVLE